jgi:hypothetical protein
MTNPPAPTGHDNASCPVSSLAAEFNPFENPYLADPYEFLAKARASEPVFYSPELDYWVVTRYEDVRQVFRDNINFSAVNALEPLTPLWQSSADKLIDAGFSGGPVLVNEDEPFHRRRRKRIGGAFSLRRVEALEPAIRQIVTDYIDKFVERGNADLVDDFVWEIPALVIFKFMGVPDEEAALVKQFAAPRTIFTWGRPTESQQNFLADDIGAYWEYCRQHVARLKAAKGDDFMSELIRAQAEDPEFYDDNYLSNTMLNFLFAGHETTTNASGNAFRILLEKRSSWDAICEDSSLIANAVEEVLRHSSSVITWRRRALRSIKIDGIEIPAGANVLLANGSANRDEAAFSEAATFDIHRRNANRHVAFGYGAHTCLGAALARLEMKVILEELTSRLPHINLVEGQQFEYSPNTSFRGPNHVLVTWDPGQNPRLRDRPTCTEPAVTSN